MRKAKRLKDMQLLTDRDAIDPKNAGLTKREILALNVENDPNTNRKVRGKLIALRARRAKR